jgi:16S rRNA (uracil1498-N3)-methyltransferase
MPNCRIHLDHSLQTGQEIVIPDEIAHYLRHVMRLNSGDAITVFNGEGGEYSATLTHLAKRHAACHIDAWHNIERELPCRIHIIQCANRTEKIETVLQKATELGAASFQISDSERATLKLPPEKAARRLQRWQKIILEACEQSERTRVPDVRWCSALKQTEPVGQAYILHPHKATPWAELRDKLRGAEEITFAIGPEGGWSERDLATLRDKGFASLTFGPRIMRTETAAPALVAAMQAILD